MRPKNRWNLFLRLPNPPKFGYLVGGYKFYLTDIENGILRGNKKPQIVFTRHDPKRAFSFKYFDPRIHFIMGEIVNRGPNPVPPQIYDATNIWDAMQAGIFRVSFNTFKTSTEIFCTNDEVQISIAKKYVTLPWIFHIYKLDFGKDRFEFDSIFIIYTRTELLLWIANFVRDEDKKNAIVSLSQDPQSKIFLNHIDLTDSIAVKFFVAILFFQGSAGEESKPSSGSLFDVLHDMYAQDIDRAAQLHIFDNLSRRENSMMFRSQLPLKGLPVRWSQPLGKSTNSFKLKIPRNFKPPKQHFDQRIRKR
jgi:hypothetical protein